MFLGLERRKAPTMIGGHHEEDEEEEPRIRLDHLEYNLNKLTSIVAQLFVSKGIESQ